MINEATITQEATDTVAYWHVELAQHDLLLAENLPCESYLNTGNRSASANGGSVVEMYPDFAAMVLLARACATLVIEGRKLESARLGLLAGACALGFRVIGDPGLHLFVGGQTIEPRLVVGGIYRFPLPPGTREIGISSNADAPANMSATVSDTRCLGIMLHAIVLRRRQLRCEIALSSLPTDSGFRELERADGRVWRWTDGAVRLDIPEHFDSREACLLDLHVAATQPTWSVEPPQSRPAHLRHGSVAKAQVFGSKSN